MITVIIVITVITVIIVIVVIIVIRFPMSEMRGPPVRRITVEWRWSLVGDGLHRSVEIDQRIINETRG